MTSYAEPVTLGDQRPRVHSGPGGTEGSGLEAVILAASFGLYLDEWQKFVLVEALRERPDHKWAAFEVGLCVPRQNGKGSILEARELAGLFLFHELQITHSAHEAKTSKEHFARLEELLRNAGYDDTKAVYKRSNEEVSILIKETKSKIRFLTRTKGAGRGLSGDVVVLDEAYALDEDQMAALMPTMAARSMSGNPQMWYTSSAGFSTSVVLGRLRDRGYAGEKRLAFFDWSAAPDADNDSRAAWAQANPGLGIRISEEFIEAERGGLSDEGFARERLGIWHNPATAAVIPTDAWQACADPASQITGAEVVFSVDSAPDHSATSIAVCGVNEAGKPHVELIDIGPGVSWAAERLVALYGKWEPVAVCLDASGPAAALIAPLREAGIEPWLLSARDVATGCGSLYEAVTTGELAHPGEPLVALALEAAKKRPIGNAWGWARKEHTGDITPLTAFTYALFGWLNRATREPKKKRTGKAWF